MELILYGAFHLMLCFIVAFIGQKRRITALYSFVLSATLTPIIGLIITLISPSLRSERAYKENSEFNKVLGILSYCLSGLILIAIIYQYFLNKDDYTYDFLSTNWTSIVVCIGFYTLGEYLHRMPMPTKSTQQDSESHQEAILISKKYRKPLVYTFLIAVVVVFVVTNPSIERFKKYKNADSSEGLTREQNWFVFSIYRDINGQPYLGILFNFFNLD